MGLDRVFRNGAMTVFKVLKDVTHDADLVVFNDDGWGTVTETLHPIKIILDEWSQDDVRYSIMSKLIEPTDIKGLVPGKLLTVEPSVEQVIRVKGTVNKEFVIVGFETDPAVALITFLLRRAANV